jgi:hypothetical protein
LLPSSRGQLLDDSAYGSYRTRPRNVTAEVTIVVAKSFWEMTSLAVTATSDAAPVPGASHTAFGDPAASTIFPAHPLPIIMIELRSHVRRELPDIRRTSLAPVTNEAGATSSRGRASTRA